MKTGVYQDRERHTAIVIKSAKNKVMYLTMRTGQITLETASEERFARDWPRFLPAHPPVKACKQYRRSGLYMSDEAARALYAVVGE